MRHRHPHEGGDPENEHLQLLQALDLQDMKRWCETLPGNLWRVTGVPGENAN